MPRNYCPGCGEEAEEGGGLFDGWSCMECGWGE